MNLFPLLKILYLSTSRDPGSSGHPDLQNYALQKPARTLGNELVGGIEDSFKINTIKSHFLLHSISNSLTVGFLLKMFFHLLFKGQQMDVDNDPVRWHFEYLKRSIEYKPKGFTEGLFSLKKYKCNMFSFQTGSGI